jgi:hypothetical protein
VHAPGVCAGPGLAHFFFQPVYGALLVRTLQAHELLGFRSTTGGNAPDHHDPTHEEIELLEGLVGKTAGRITLSGPGRAGAFHFAMAALSPVVQLSVDTSIPFYFLIEDLRPLAIVMSSQGPFSTVERPACWESA